MRGKYKRRKANRIQYEHTQAVLNGRNYARNPNNKLESVDWFHTKPPWYKEQFIKGFVLERLGVPDSHQPGFTSEWPPVVVSNVFGINKTLQSVIDAFAKTEIAVLKKYHFLPQNEPNI